MAVGRFQVMALLQAARAKVLGLPLESAYSWGLNRAIFIAAAKRGFKGGGDRRTEGGTRSSKTADVYFLGDDMAYKQAKDDVLLFSIGGKVQTKEDFERQVKSRFGDVFKEAWNEALAYVKSFDKETPFRLMGSSEMSTDPGGTSWPGNGRKPQNTEVSVPKSEKPIPSGPAVLACNMGGYQAYFCCLSQE